ncbi:ankyrin repeat domain-containing protein [Peribacillus butanolivorans]|uniref:ankyrin repeat domain-containing protein n=1 Tax=Peribacillus butanolivorans TaxID=421767 RepID=UPI00207C8621|nr:ankyrin repeat domain-containing protein [Peribacillus butanolivorans]MCO0596671.1 ankyrin repeat domain-containing protein [Peribacillus butanolivorans]
MWKWLAVIIGCILLLQGFVLDDKEDLKIQGKEREGVNEQLIQAAERKETETISRLIEEGADINTQDSEGRTATMIATYNNDFETAKILITAGADVNIQDDMKNNPFLYAGAEGYLEILKLTINAGADPKITNRYGGTALIPASEHGNVNVIKELLTNTDIDINHVNNLGWTALLEAIILSNGDEKQQQTVQLLIDHGADVNIADHNNVTPLQHAREKGFKEIEQILTKEGTK